MSLAYRGIIHLIFTISFSSWYGLSSRISDDLLTKLHSFKLTVKYRREPKIRFKILVTRPHPYGIASKCDWIFYHREIILHESKQVPKIIYCQSIQLPFFGENILPLINFKFVLISGGNDRSVPRNLNPAFGPYKGPYLQFNQTGGSLWEALINNPYLIHWFAENKDMNHLRVSTLPTGMNPNECQPDTIIPISSKPLSQRPPYVLQIDRVRSGQQAYKDRKDVEVACGMSGLCKQGFVSDHENGTNADGTHKDLSHQHNRFLELVLSYPFVMCVRGGGIDPSPKAWEAIRAGTIPVILNNTLRDAYSQLPVAFVDNFTEFLLGGEESRSLMRKWTLELGPYYKEGSALRNQTLHRLSAKYWFQGIVDKLSPHFSLEDLLNYYY